MSNARSVDRETLIARFWDLIEPDLDAYSKKLDQLLNLLPDDDLVGVVDGMETEEGDGDEPEEEEEETPDEGDLITEDYVEFFTVGESYTAFRRLDKPDLVVGPDEEWEDAVLAYMEEQKFWPNVWFMSDHGNCHLLRTTEGIE